jgi:thioredoxin 1
LTGRGFAGYSENRMATMEITDTDFDEKVLKSTIPVLVDFWAPWCGPCRMAGPVLDELAEEYEGKVQIVKINIDNNQKSAGDYDVMSIPTTVLIKGGNEIGRQIGFGGKKVFEDLIKTGI